MHHSTTSRSSRGSSSRPASICLLACLCTWVAASAAFAQQSKPEQLFASMRWNRGPTTVVLCNVATIDLPAGFWCATDTASLKSWSELTQNPHDASQVAVVIPDPATIPSTGELWSLSFAYNPAGYVADDEKDSINDDVRNSILNVIRTATEQDNNERRRQGWPTLQVVGWQSPPHYDARTNNLTWSVLARGSDNSDSANYNSRLLGRGGVLSANMIVSPQGLPAVVPAYNELISRTRFVQGQTYAEYRSGDKTAAYGLTALATGGTAVVAAKGWKGFAKLGALAIAGIVGVLAVVAKGLGSLWSKLTGQPTLATAAAQASDGGTASDAAAGVRVVKCGVCDQGNRLSVDRLQPKCGRCGAALS